MLTGGGKLNGVFFSNCNMNNKITVLLITNIFMKKTYYIPLSLFSYNDNCITSYKLNKMYGGKFTLCMIALLCHHSVIMADFLMPETQHTIIVITFMC